MLAFLTNSTIYLNAEELRYARRWIRLCLQEWGQAWERGSTLRLFRQSSVQREAQGFCISNLRLESTERMEGENEGDGNTFLLCFSRICNVNDNGLKPLSAINLESGSFVTLSTDNQFALLMATVHSLSEKDGFQLIKLVSDKQLPLSLSEDPSFLYHVDKHDGFTSHALALGNIASLLENNPNSKRLRSILTTGTSNCIQMEFKRDDKENDQEMNAEFQQQIQIDTREIIKEILLVPDYALVKASRKEKIASLLIPLVCLLLKMGKSILLCANSNSQIDELLMLLRFEQNIDAKHLLRIGSRKAVPEKLHELLVENRLAVELQNCTLEEDNKAKAYMETAQTLVEQKSLLVASTVHSVSSHSFFAAPQRRFDFCLLCADTELLSEPLLCAPLLRADRFVLFATNYQQNRGARIGSSGQRRSNISKNSLFDRLQQMLEQKTEFSNPNDSTIKRQFVLMEATPTKHVSNGVKVEPTGSSTKKLNKSKQPTPKQKSREIVQQAKKRTAPATLFDFWGQTPSKSGKK